MEMQAQASSASEDEVDEEKRGALWRCGRKGKDMAGDMASERKEGKIKDPEETREKDIRIPT